MRLSLNPSNQNSGNSKKSLNVSTNKSARFLARQKNSTAYPLFKAGHFASIRSYTKIEE
jgi:hypothetical protein